MNTKRPVSWMARLAAASLLALPAWSSVGQTRFAAEGEAGTLGSAQAQTVVVTRRPLRTFRGQTVRLGRNADAQRAIGVVRPLRETPRFGQDRFFRSGVRFGQSSRFFGGFGSRFEKEIGVVRPFVTFDPPVRNPPKTYTNPFATLSPTASPRNAQASALSVTPSPARTVLGQEVEAAAVTAVTEVEIPEAYRGDPWTLLDQGFYRQARQQFAQLGDTNPTTRTGHALAAVLSGDLNGGVTLMPADPKLPVGTTFRDATLQRLDQVQQFLYADQPEMQAKLQKLVDLAQPTSVRVD